MKKNQENRENLKEKEWYREKIAEMVNRIEDIWILQQILRFISSIIR